jgi:hypothetical protein
MIVTTQKSSFAKLVMYENLISLSIISLIGLIILFKNFQQHKYPLVIKGKKLEERTLGQLEIELSRYSPDVELLKSLHRFVQLRNKIMHNMLIKYDKMNDLVSDATKAIKEAEKLTCLLEEATSSVTGEIEKKTRSLIEG